MKKSIKYLILFLVLTNSMFAQKRQIDSLISVLKSDKIKNLHDTIKCRTMIDLSWLLVYSNPDSALHLTLRAKKLAGSNHKLLEGACYHALGWFYNRKAEYTKSLESYDNAMAIWKKYSLLEKEAATLGNIGSVYADMGDIPKGLDYYFKSQLICEQLGLKNEIAIGNNNNQINYRGH